MTRYSIPPQPDVEHVWLIEPGVGQRSHWWREDGTASYRCGATVCTWAQLLALGEVSDVHPDLPADYPLPWTVSSSGVIYDANNGRVGMDIDPLAPFVVKAVNAYGERFTPDAASPSPLPGGEEK